MNEQLRQVFRRASVLAFAALSLAACSGGGSAVPPTVSSTTTTPGTTVPTTTTNGATIGSISSTLTAVSGGAVQILGAAATTTGDVDDTAPIESPGITSAVITQAASMTSLGTHALKTNGVRPASAVRRSQNSAQNSPWDISYFGGPVLGGAQSDNIFVNCNASCRSKGNLHVGRFINDLYNDTYLSLLLQYLSSPGEIIVPGGKFAKGATVDIPFTYDTPPTGFTNPVITEREIVQIVVAGINALPAGNQKLVHIYNVLLPPNVDTCITGNQQCWSPDNPTSFYFCGYHGALKLNGAYIPYTVIPWSSLNYCSASPTTVAFPNQTGPGNDPADAMYGVLSHETFETITDPIPGSGWFNYTTGYEIGDECSGFQNFVSLNGRNYYIQSEYSDVGQQCISANLTAPQQTP